MGKQQIRRVTGVEGAENTHGKLKNSLLKIMNVQTGKERGVRYAKSIFYGILTLS